MFWFFSQEACEILAPQPGIKPAPPALRRLTHWTAREVPRFLGLEWKAAPGPLHKKKKSPGIQVAALFTGWGDLIHTLHK